MQEESRARRVYAEVVEKGAYTFAIAVGLGMIWFVIALLGMGAVILLLVLAVLLTLFKVGFLWFLR